MDNKLNFVILTLLCIIIYYIAYISAKSALALIVAMGLCFMIHTNRTITKEDEKMREKMLRNPKSRYTYYKDINS